MEITNVLAEMVVRDLDAALTWYEKFFGRPADRRPMPGLAEWQLTAGGGVQVFESAENAGRSIATLGTSDVHAAIAELRSRGVEVADPEPGSGIQVTQVTDPDGNTLTLAEPPSA